MTTKVKDPATVLNSSVPALTVTTDTNGVPFFKRIMAGGVEWTFLSPAVWCEIDLYNTSTFATTTLGASDFTYTITRTGTTVTVVATGKAPYASVVATFTITEADDGGRDLTASVATHSTGKALHALRWPYLRVEPHGDPEASYLAWPFGPGVVIREPHASGVSHVMASPPAPQYFGFVDGTSLANLHVSTDDDAGHYKAWQADGDGTACNVWLTHFPDGGNFTTNLGYTQPFNLHLTCFRGSAAIPWVDAAMRYRLGAVQLGRPWIVRGHWQDLSFNARARGVNVVVVHHGTDYADLGTAQDELGKLATFLNPPEDGDIVQLYYDWGNNPDDYPPDYTDGSALRAAWNTMQDDLHAAGILTAPYMLLSGWSEGAGGVYDIANVPAHSFLQNADGSFAGDIYDSQLIRQWDYAKNVDSAGATSAIIDVTLGTLLTAMAGHLPKGYYIDAFHLPPFDQHDSTRSVWTWSHQNEGRVSAYESIVDTLQGSDAASFTMTEWPDEHLAGVADIVFASSLTGYTGGYPTSGAFADVFGELHRIASFDNFITSATDIGQLPLAADISDLGWHMGGIAGYNSNVAATGLVTTAVLDPTTPLYHFFNWLKTQLAAWPTVKPYMTGRRMRPACVTNERARVDAQELDATWFQAHGPDFQVHSSTWQDLATGNIGVVLTHHWPAGFAPQVGPKTVRLRLVSRDYGITNEAKTVRVTVGAGTPTTVTTMRCAAEFDVTINPGTVVLVEVMLPVEGPVTYPVA